ncbi:MAG: DMT family transporter [Patescibacteria group bacterium]|nr:DMT family transporter [bacterium]MDZ4227039.1 DMT family transporter [Patescibacteria group bacterium]
MTDDLFFVFVMISILGYGIHVPLIALFARRFDSLIVTVYRNLSLGIFILPLLYFVPFSEIAAIKGHLLTLVIAAVTGFISFMWTLNGMRYLPIGVSNSIVRTFNVIFAIMLGALFFGEYLSPLQLLLLVGILAVAVALALSRSQHAHLDVRNMGRGSMFSVFAGIGASVSFFFFSILSRELNPLVAAYFWETSIGVCALLYLLFHLARGRYQGAVLLPIRQASAIVGASFFVVVGTGGMAFAFNHGPYSLASGLGTTIILVTTLISWFLFKEKLGRLQIGLIILAVLLMFLLKVFS